LDNCSIHCLITSLGSAEIKETEEEVEAAQLITYWACMSMRIWRRSSWYFIKRFLLRDWRFWNSLGCIIELLDKFFGLVT
ncbi:19898_t:CDS:2, partial [Dentiscutata erythropus]